MSTITATVSFSNFPNNTPINFTFPNSFAIQVSGALTNPSPTAIGDGQFYQIAPTVSGSGSLQITLQLLSCNSNGGGEPVNFGNLSFDCFAPTLGSIGTDGNPQGIQSEFSGNDLSIVPASNTVFTYQYGGLPFEITNCSGCTQTLNNPGSFTRSFTVIIRAPQLTQLAFNYSDEADVNETSFSINGSPIGNFVNLNGLQQDANCNRTFTATQTGSIECEEFTASGAFSLTLNCGDCPPYVESRTVDVSINTDNPTFSVTNTLTPNNGTINGCGGTYTNTYTFTNTNGKPIEILNLVTPINTGLYTITGIEINGQQVSFDNLPNNNDNLSNASAIDVGTGTFTVTYTLELNCLYFQNCGKPQNYLNPEAGGIQLTFLKTCTDQPTIINVGYPPILGHSYSTTLLGGAFESDFVEGDAIHFDYDFRINQAVQFGTTTFGSCGNIQYEAVLFITTSPGENTGTTTYTASNGQRGIIITFPFTPAAIEEYTNITFDISPSECPWPSPPFNGFGTFFFTLEIRAICDDCSDCYRVLNCISDQVEAHCAGDCHSKVGTTEDISVERTTFGFEDRTAFYNSIPMSRANLIAQFGNNEDNTEFKTQLRSLYPYDLVKFSADGNYDHTWNEAIIASALGFEIDFTNDYYQHLQFMGAAITYTALNANNEYENYTITFPAPTLQQTIEGETGYKLIFLSNDFISNQSYDLHFEAIYRSMPQLPPGVYETEMRMQFIGQTPGNLEPEKVKSCDSFGSFLKLIVPTISSSSLFIAPNLELSEIVNIGQFPDYINVVRDLSNSFCKSNFLLEAAISGGYGDEDDDFPFEYRPLIKWPNNVILDDISVENTIAQAFGIINDNAIQYPNFNYDQSTDILQNPLAPPTNLFPLIRPLDKKIGEDFYNGLLLTFDKKCTNEDQIYGNIEVTKNAYIHDGFNLPSFPADFINLHELSDPLITDYNLVLNTGPTAINTGYNFSFPLSIIPQTVALDNFYFYYTITDNNDNPLPSSAISDISGWAGNLVTNSNIPHLYYFQQLPNTLINGSIPIHLNCNSPSFKLKFYIGNFCKTSDYDAFILNPENATPCQFSSKTIILNPQPPLLTPQNVTNTLSFDNSTGTCRLKWDITINNPSTQSEISHPTLSFNTPNGLILLPNYTLSINGGAPVTINASAAGLEGMQPPFQNNLIPVFTITTNNEILASGGTFHYTIYFQFSGNLCQNNVNILSNGLLGKFRGLGYCDSESTPLINLLTFSNSFNQPSLLSGFSNLSSSTCCVNSAQVATNINACSQTGNGAILLTSPAVPFANYIVNVYSGNSVENITVTSSPFSISKPQGTYGILFNLGDGAQMFSTVQIVNGEIYANVSPENITVCPNTSFTFTASDNNANNANEPHTFTWINNTTSAVACTSAVFTGSVTATTTYNLTILNTVTNCSIKRDVTVDVYDIVAVQFNNPTNICAGQFFDLEVTPSGGSLTFNATAYNDFSGELSIDANSLNTGINPITYNYTNSDGCAVYGETTVNLTDENCNCTCRNALAATREIPNTIQTGEQLLEFLGNSPINGMCLLITSNISFNNQIDFINCDIKFAAGTSFKIEDNGYLSFDECILKGCDYMWKGLRNSGRLKLLNSTVRDAQFGVELITKNQIQTSIGPVSIIDNSTLTNNFLGINTNYQNGVNHLLALTNSTFIGGALLPAFNNQIPAPSATGGVGGMRLFRYASTIPIDNTNTFRNLQNGIITGKCEIDLHGPRFIDIQPEYGSTSYNSLSNYIQSTNKSAGVNIQSGCKIKIIGSGGLAAGAGVVPEETQDTGPTTFEGCHIGVNSAYSKVEIRNCIFDDSENFKSYIGVNLFRLNSLNNYVIEYNRIRAQYVGIASILSNPSIPSSITRNNISMNRSEISPDLEDGSVGVLFHNINGANNVSISNNTVNLHSLLNTHGIYFNGAFGGGIAQNFIRRYQASEGYGIYASNSSNLNVSCNRSVGQVSDATVGQSSDISNAINGGYYFQNCPNSIINANETDFTRLGFVFAGENSAIDISSNTIGSHGNSNNPGIGLLLGYNNAINPNPDPSAIDVTNIGVQFDKRNVWQDFSNNIGARKSGTILFGAINRFDVLNGQNGTFTNIYPTHSPLNSCDEDQFFSCLSGSTSIVSPNCNFGSNITGTKIMGTQLADSLNLNNLIGQLIDGTLNFGDLTPEMVYSIKRNVDALLLHNDFELADSGLVVQLQLAMLNSNIREMNTINSIFSNIEISKDDLGLIGIHALQRDSLVKIYQTLLGISASGATAIDAAAGLSSIPEGFGNSLLTKLSNTEIAVTLNNLNNLIQSHTAAIDQIKFNYIMQNRIRYDSAAVSNQNLLYQNDAERLEKQINELYILAEDSTFTEFTIAQQTRIDSIAYVCPVIGGQAVFKARSLQASYDLAHFYDDKLLCANQGLAFRKARAESKIIFDEQLKLYPNPSNGLLHVALTTADESTYTLEIFNLLGTKVFSQQNLSKYYVLNLQALGFQSGFYTLTLTQNTSNKRFNAKFVYEN